MRSTPEHEARLVTSRSSLLCVLVAALVLSFGCTKKPTREDCEEMIDHLLKVQLAETEGADNATAVVNSMREELLTDCLKSASKEKVDCFLAAETNDEVRKCYKR